MPETDGKLFKLPSVGETVSRLTSVYDDERFRSYYWRVAEKAGRQIRSVTAVVNLFLYQAEEDLAGEQYDLVYRGLLFRWMPNWMISLIDDKDAILEYKRKFGLLDWSF